jgi:hypothetical protein
MKRDLDPLRHLVSVISGGSYSLSLATIDSTQILYNGKITYTSFQRGWCHLLLLRSKNRFSKQLLAIITQTPDCPVSIVNTIEGIATFIVDFFCQIYPPSARGEKDEYQTIEVTPDNTIFVQYLPAGCFGDDLHPDDTIGVMNFDWKDVQVDQSRSIPTAKDPAPADNMWRSTDIDAINDLIARL